MIFVVSLFGIISENKSGLPQHENRYLSYFCALIYFEEILEIGNFDLFSKYRAIEAIQVKYVRQPQYHLYQYTNKIFTLVTGIKIRPKSGWKNGVQRKLKNEVILLQYFEGYVMHYIYKISLLDSKKSSEILLLFVVSVSSSGPLLLPAKTLQYINCITHQVPQ
ncbi:Hypothetical_protein [Hexamita inflata]|uniref:Hypothetical_protein n=1 Tax=Hexamita inflata TaxID=28002 RepID=A0AA86TF23_9EUKA|nr:Hypothetical protein HINF_LOCUS3241 [Hexamita inflata]